MMITQPNNATLVHKPGTRSKPKRRSPIKLILGGLAALLLGLIAVIAVVIAYAFWGNPKLNDRPLVLIHSPLNWEQLAEGDGVLVHATARSPGGIKRAELWVDDQLIAQREADQGKPPSSMVLSANWTPTIAGSHRLIVRAISASDVDGQASVVVESIEGDEQDLTHTVQEGETLDAIAQGAGTTVDDLTILNPGLDPAAPPAAGTEIIVPDSEPSSEGAQPIPTDSEPPPAEGEAPALFDFLFFGELVSVPQLPAEPTQLRMELLALRTSIAYEGLTCYIGMADQTPRRYPDADWDPSTDESFTRVKSQARNGVGWNVAQYLAGRHTPAFSWPENQPLPLAISCVGIGGGGTQAFQLGRLKLAIPPDKWDGTIRRAEVVGLEGSFAIGYRVGHTGNEAYVSPKPVLDTSMAAPTNLRINTNFLDLAASLLGRHGSGSLLGDLSTDRSFVLMWDYVPHENEAPIDGFRVYANDTLQWTVGSNQRFPLFDNTYYDTIPSQWLHPPCGEEYTLVVTAWRAGDAEGDADEGYESDPEQSSITVETPADACHYRGRITFESLETFVLDEDGSSENRSGKIGPPYGHFFANEERAIFDFGSLRDNISPTGLNDNQLYLINDRWNFDRPPSFFVELDEGDSLDIGFTIMDEDSGNPDDPICEGYSAINPSDTSLEGEFYSTNRRCKVTYRWEPSASNPARVTSITPALDITNIVADGAAETLRFTVKNVGRAAWAHHPLEIGVSTRTGIIEETLVFEDIYLEPEQSIDFEYEPRGSSYDWCFTPDPNNKVEEGSHDLEEWGSRMICPERPDLKILGVMFSSEDNIRGQIRVDIQNIGDGPIRNGTVRLVVDLANDVHSFIDQSWYNVSLEQNQIERFELEVDTATRGQLLGGYTVNAVLADQIPEASPGGNSYVVRGMEHLTVLFCRAHTDAILHNDDLDANVVFYNITTWVINGAHHFRAEDSWDGGTLDTEDLTGCREMGPGFDIAGDQWLRIIVNPNYWTLTSEDEIGPIDLIHSPWDGWDVTGASARGTNPDEWPCAQAPYQWASSNFSIDDETGSWQVGYVICIDNP